MKISGFTMGRNVSKLYYPVKESILSILPLVDEFVVALGKGDEDDNTRELIESIGSPKIRIIDTVWDLEKYPRGTEHAHQTDIAKEHCTGDWLFYLQSDEVVHEKYLPVIKARCEELLHDTEVEGLLFKYRHFWGDYNHYHGGHGWYRNEIRIIRNRPDIHSWESAQSFRRIPHFDGKDYRQQEGTFKLKVASVDAYIYHYGWVRPPRMMKAKMKAIDTNHKGSEKVAELDKTTRTYSHFDYGPLDRLEVFKETHPEVMREMISRFNWADELQMSGKPNPERVPHKHELPKYRLVSFLEKYILLGTPVGEFKNYILLKRGK
ncbi:MAG: glycosyltransferase family 2 protein [Flavobacteriales bacterium]|nr:glycosyltransferase family 2 protein [Flavobacteriales bacterium]